MTGQQWSVFSLMEGEWVSEQATAGENTKILANGAVYDLDKGRIVANPGGGTSAITQANASALATLRWQQAREQAAEAGQIGLARNSTDGKWTSALANIAEKQAELAMDPDAGRASTEAARYVRDTATGHWFTAGNNGSGNGSSGSITLSATIPEDLAMRLLAEIRSKQGEIATVIDVESE